MYKLPIKYKEREVEYMMNAYKGMEQTYRDMGNMYNNMRPGSLNQDLYELMGKKVTYRKLKSLAMNWNTGFQVALAGINWGPLSRDGGILLAYERNAEDLGAYMSRNFPPDVVYKSMYIPTKQVISPGYLATR